MISFKQFLTESIQDRGIFKAVVVIGIAGSGKSYALTKISGTIKPRVVTMDRAAEHISRKSETVITPETWPSFRNDTHRITTSSLVGYINGMLPLFVETTSFNPQRAVSRINILKNFGYDIAVVHVKTDIDLAIKRAEERGKKIGRYVNEEEIRKMFIKHDACVSVLSAIASKTVEIENSGDGFSDTDLHNAYKAIEQWLSLPVENPIGKDIIGKMTASKDKYLAPSIMSIEQIQEKCSTWFN